MVLSSDSRTRARTRRVLILPLATMLFATMSIGVACSDASVTRVNDVSAISVSPSDARMIVGGTLALDVQVEKQGGTPMATEVFWSSSDQTIATVSTAGVVTARKAGNVNIAVTALGNSAVVPIVVTNPPVIPPVLPPAPAAVSTVTVSLASTLAVDKTAQATATLKSASGATLTGRTITWSSSNNPVATVSSTGVVTGKKPGTATITATSEGKQGTATITVHKN